MMEYWSNTSIPACTLFGQCGYGGATFLGSIILGAAAAQAQVPALIAGGVITPAQAQGDMFLIQLLQAHYKLHYLLSK